RCSREQPNSSCSAVIRCGSSMEQDHTFPLLHWSPQNRVERKQTKILPHLPRKSFRLQPGVKCKRRCHHLQALTKATRLLIRKRFMKRLYRTAIVILGSLSFILTLGFYHHDASTTTSLADGGEKAKL